MAGCDSAHVGEWAGAWEQCWIDRQWTEGTVEYCDLTVVDDQSGEHIDVPKILLKWVRVLPIPDSASSSFAGGKEEGKKKASRSTAKDRAKVSCAAAADRGSASSSSSSSLPPSVAPSVARAPINPPVKEVNVDPRSVAAAFARSQLALGLSAAWKVRAAASDALSAAREVAEKKKGGEWLAAKATDGRRYYYHSETKESVRHPPARFVSLRDVAARKAERNSRRNAAVARFNAPLGAAAGAEPDADGDAAAVAEVEMDASAAAMAAAPLLPEAEEERCNQRALVARLIPLPFARAIVPRHRALFGEWAPSICIPLRLPRRTPIATDTTLLRHARRATARLTRTFEEFPTRTLVSYDFEGLEWESGYGERGGAYEAYRIKKHAAAEARREQRRASRHDSGLGAPRHATLAALQPMPDAKRAALRGRVAVSVAELHRLDAKHRAGALTAAACEEQRGACISALLAGWAQLPANGARANGHRLVIHDYDIKKSHPQLLMRVLGIGVVTEWSVVDHAGRGALLGRLILRFSCSAAKMLRISGQLRQKAKLTVEYTLERISRR